MEPPALVGDHGGPSGAGLPGLRRRLRCFASESTPSRPSVPSPRRARSWSAIGGNNGRVPALAPSRGGTPSASSTATPACSCSCWRTSSCSSWSRTSAGARSGAPCCPPRRSWSPSATRSRPPAQRRATGCTIGACVALAPLVLFVNSTSVVGLTYLLPGVARHRDAAGHPEADPQAPPGHAGDRARRALRLRARRAAVRVPLSGGERAPQRAVLRAAGPHLSRSTSTSASSR